MRRKYFRLLSLLLMAHFYLLVFSNNLPGILKSSAFWIPLWVFSLLVFHPKQILNKRYVPLIIYVGFFLIGFQTIWNNLIQRQGRILMEIGGLFSSVSMLYYFISVKDYKWLKIIVNIGIFFIIISSITSIIGFVRFPMAARLLAGVLAKSGDIETINFYHKIGIGGYGFFLSVVYIPGLLLSSYKLGYHNRILGQYYILGMLITYIASIQSQYFANFLISSFLLILVIINLKNISKFVIFIIIILVLVSIIPKEVFINLIHSMADMFSNIKELNYKLNDLALYIENPDSGQGKEVTARASRFPFLFNSFLQNPLIGGGKWDQHLHWMNKLSSFGLIGTLSYVYLVINFVKRISEFLTYKQKKFYTYIILSYFFLGIIKIIYGRELFFVIFFIIPGYFIVQQYVKEEKYIV